MIKLHETELKLRGALDPRLKNKRPSYIKILRYIAEAMPEEYEGCIYSVINEKHGQCGLEFLILKDSGVVFKWSELIPGADSLEICRWIIDEVDSIRKRTTNGR